MLIWRQSEAILWDTSG